MSSENVGVEENVTVEEQEETPMESIVIEDDEFFGDTASETETEETTDTETEIVVDSVQVIDYSQKLDTIITHLEFYTCILILALVWFLFKWCSRLLDKLL